MTSQSAFENLDPETQRKVNANAMARSQHAREVLNTCVNDYLMSTSTIDGLVRSPCATSAVAVATAYLQACFLALDFILGDFETWLKSATQAVMVDDQLRGSLEQYESLRESR